MMRWLEALTLQRLKILELIGMPRLEELQPSEQKKVRKAKRKPLNALEKLTGKEHAKRKMREQTKHSKPFLVSLVQ